MKKKKIIGLTISLLLFFLAGMVNASTLVHSSANLGDYSNGSITINLSSLAAHSEVYINFDLYIMDSWDGETGSYAGPDDFGFSVDGSPIHWSVSNFSPNSSSETNTVLADSTGDYNGIITWGYIDRYFEDYNNGFTFTHSSASLTLSFFGQVLQGMTDESWRVTELTVKTDAGAPVPEPATMLLFGLGLLGLAGVNRRKK